MRDDDWFAMLTLGHELAMKLPNPDAQARFRAALTLLQQRLDDPTSKRAFDAIPGLNRFFLAVRLTAEDRRRAEQLGERLWNSAGAGRTAAEEALLGQVGVQGSPDSLPFFRAALEMSRERDSFQVRRRRIAVASVAVIARLARDEAARAQLDAWLEHPDVTVRTEATAVYGRVHLTKKGRLEGAALAAMERVAYAERAFAPRFLARRWLMAAGIRVRSEPPDGVYAFKASLGRTSRSVELTTAQSLGDLASAILDAFQWDHDHLYEFALTADLKDRRFILPDEPEPMELVFTTEKNSGASDGMNLPLGAFGFPKGHAFIFRFDFGDDHRFHVKVEDIQPQRTPKAKYPRVVAKDGKAPPQYPRY